MPRRVKDQFTGTISAYVKDLQNLIDEKPHRRETIERANEFLDELSKVTAHMDLQGSGPSEKAKKDLLGEAAYAEHTSAKFIFLGHLTERMRHSRINLYIAAKGGLLMRYIERYLTAKAVQWVHFNETGPNAVTRKNSELFIFLIPSERHHNTQNLHWPEPDAIIAFDETFSLDRITNFHRNTSPPPIIRLIIHNTQEHVDLCVPRMLDPFQRLLQIVWVTLQAQRRIVPRLEPSPSVCADYIAPYVQSHAMKRPDRGWPLPPIPPIDGVSVLLHSDSSQLETPFDMDGTDGPLRFWPNPQLPQAQSPSVQAGSQQPGKRQFVSC